MDHNVMVGKVNGDNFKVGDKMTITVKEIRLGPELLGTETLRSFKDYEIYSRNGRTFASKGLKDKGGAWESRIVIAFNNKNIITDIVINTE